jgi:hypothetical protein
MKRVYTLLLFSVFLCTLPAACGIALQENGKSTSPISTTSFVEPTILAPTIPVKPAETLIPTSTPDLRLSPEDWQEWPVVPTFQPEMRLVFQRGMAVGNNPAIFTKIGDGEISTVWFLTQYDLGPDNYDLGIYIELLPVINQFSGSFGKVGLVAGRGYNTSIILGPVPTGTPGCNVGDSRLACELRTIRPAFALVSLGTNQVWQPEIFERELRQIVKLLLEAEVVPILATKADNLEGDQRINQIITWLAYEYRLPLWNFWLAVQGLPGNGLQSDREHLTYAYSDFSNPDSFQYAWPWRNLTALQVLNAVYKGVTSQP